MARSKSKAALASEVEWLLAWHAEHGEFPSAADFKRKFGKAKSAYYSRLTEARAALQEARAVSAVVTDVLSREALRAWFEQAGETVMEALAQAEREGLVTVKDGATAIGGISQIWDRVLSDGDKRGHRGRPELLEALEATQHGDGQ